MLPPELFTRIVVSASDVTIGDFVIVTSLENIDAKKEFIASEIQLSQTIKK